MLPEVERPGKRPRVGDDGGLCSNPGCFNDPATADVLLRLQLEQFPSSLPDSYPNPQDDFLDLHLHSSALRRARYFASLIFDRWLSAAPADEPSRFTLAVPSKAFDAHVAVLRLLYVRDFSGAILSVSDALEKLHVALQLLFDDCVAACVRFLEAVPWSEDEEEVVLSLVPLLPREESRDLIARLSPVAPHYGTSSAERMLHGLVSSAMQTHANVATVKAFVARLLRGYPSRDPVRRVLDRSFLAVLESVRELMGKYARPEVRAAGGNEEAEASQRLSLHAAMVNTRHMLWLVERMIELGVGDAAAREWSEQAGLAGDLQRTFRDDAWRNITPGLPSLVMRCTGRLASAVASGSIMAPRQVRAMLVMVWLPVLNVCRDTVYPMPSGHKFLYQELEETFLRIISTLPMSDAQELLQQCLSFSTPDVDDCPHLTLAFNTWFRRANRGTDDGNAS